MRTTTKVGGFAAGLLAVFAAAAGIGAAVGPAPAPHSPVSHDAPTTTQAPASAAPSEPPAPADHGGH